MKKILFITALLFGCLSVKYSSAQITFRAGININSQPDWGPIGHPQAHYYYMPDIDAYYDVQAHQYVYRENNIWVHNGNLPDRYRDYDRYHSYKVVINDRNPWENNNYHRTKYAAWKGRHDQQVIRDSHDERYRNHWKENGDNGHHDHRDHVNVDH